MEESRLGISVEYIPAHKYMGIWEKKASNYGEFWEHHDCDTVCGYVTSMEKNAHPHEVLGVTQVVKKIGI